jgi:hypothetical protein
VPLRSVIVSEIVKASLERPVVLAVNAVWRRGRYPVAVTIEKGAAEVIPRTNVWAVPVQVAAV